jgi:hypothetical protein
MKSQQKSSENEKPTANTLAISAQGQTAPATRPLSRNPPHFPPTAPTLDRSVAQKFRYLKF